MNIQKVTFAIASSICLMGLTSALVLQVSAQSVPLDGSDPKATEKSNRPMPIRLTANKDLPSNAFKKQDSFTKNLIAGSALEKFEIITYQQYLRTYANGVPGVTDISPDRMVAVMVVNFPKGLVAQNGEYSRARVVSAMDAQTGDTISYEITGKLTKSYGPSVVFSEDGTLLIPLSK